MVRAPLRRLEANDAAQISSVASRQMQVKPVFTLSTQQQRYLSTRGHEASQTFPPRIQDFFDRKNPVELSPQGAAKAKETLFSQREKLLDEITKEDPEWLEEVIKEIRNDVLVGTMSEPVRNLCHTLMRWLRTQGFMAQIAEDLLHRLIQEEDAGSGRRVNPVLYSIAIDAWAKQSSSPDAPERAEALLQLMHDRYNEKPSQRPQPRASHVSQVLVAWSNSSLPHAPQRAEQLLRWMEDESNKFPPSVHAYTSVIHAYAIRGKAHDAERILRLMEARLKDDPDKAVRPNVKTFTAVVNAWAGAGQGKRGAHMAQAVRQRLEQLYKKLQDEDLKPNIKLLTSLMQAWANSDSPEQCEKVEQIFKEILDLRESLSDEERNHPSNEINIYPYNRLMQVWSKSGNPEKAERILNDMLDRVSVGDKDAVAPSNLSWTTVAQGWARKGKVEQTENILKRMHEHYCAGMTSAKRNIVIYNTLLLAWRKSSDPLAANKAQRLLDWMEEQADSGIEELRPNEISFDIVISAWRDSRQIDRSGKMVLELLSRMEAYLQKTNVKRSDAVVSAYLAALTTLARGGKNDTQVEVLKLLHRIEAIHQSGSMGPILTNHCYHVAIAVCAWAPTRDGEEIAEDILLRMEASPDRNFQPKKRSYEAAIAAWARSFKDESPVRAHAILKRLEKRVQGPDSPCEPSNKIYNYILSACVASKVPEAAEIARDVLETMVEKRGNGNETIYPSAGIFKLTFGDRFDQRDFMSAGPVEEIINRMEDPSQGVPLDETFLFNCYLYALTVWGWSVDLDAAAHAERLWERMDESSYVCPDLECFNSLLRAYTNRIDRKEPDKTIPIKADKLLCKMEREHGIGNIDWRPDSTSFNCVIEIWAKSKIAGAAQRAFQLLERMDAIYKKHRSDHVKPSGDTYAMVLLACALTPARDEGRKLHHFNIAVRAFNHLRDSEYCEPDRSLYNRLLMCAIYLAPDHEAKVKMTRHIFLLCCRKSVTVFGHRYFLLYVSHTSILLM